MIQKISTVSIAIAGILVLSLNGMSSAAFAETTFSLSENTKPPLQIVNQSELKVAVQVNHADTVPNGISKQVLAAKNLYDQ